MAITDAIRNAWNRQIAPGGGSKIGSVIQAAEWNISNLLDATSGTATHDYAGAAVTWDLTADEAKKGYLKVTNANGAVAVTATPTLGKTYIVTNTSGQALTIKKAGGTGIVIASTKTAIVIGTGTDFARVTADA